MALGNTGKEVCVGTEQNPRRCSWSGVGKSLGQEPVRHRLTDVVTPPSLGPSPGPRNRCPGDVPPTGGQESDLRLLAGPRSPSEGAGEECVPGPNFGFATKTGFAK